MKLRLRLLWLIIASFWKKPIDISNESILNLRVLPNDIDITKMTNDRYSALMDLGRMDCVFRAGLRSAMIKNKWIPVASFNTIRFRYPLKVFQKYQLKTRIIWWDETTFYWEQTFERKGRVVATGHVCATLIDKNGSVPSKTIVDIVGPNVLKPDKPKVVTKLREIENFIHDTQKE
jgi:acyl-CoA thioesterase FadM